MGIINISERIKNMENENTLAKRISAAGINSAYDEACKCLLANKQILARIVKTCVEEFQECSVKDIEEKYLEGLPEVADISVHQDESAQFIRGVNTEDATMTEGTVLFDIRFRAVAPATGEPISLIINVEAQNDYYPGYPLLKRGIYYGSRLISAQYGTEFMGSHYEKIKKVYSIWICTNPPKSWRNTITSYSFKETALIGNSEEKKENYDLITVAMICLGGSEDKNYDGLLKMLDVLLTDTKDAGSKKKILQEEFDIAMTEKLESEVLGMCNLSKGIFEKAWDEGWDKARIEAVKSLMEELNLSAEKSMDILKIPEEERELYKEALKEETVVQV